ncbi:MAG: MFS transporter [Deltaproteobacteria bacterium]|nr:MFS transporter [Deltaproteobacteria bacterium]
MQKGISIIHKASKFDWWLTGFCLSRTLNALVFMTYAAALPILQKQWSMSAAAAGLISSGFQFGYAASLVLCSALADRMGPKPLFLGSMTSGTVFSLGFALLARDYLSALCFYTLVGVSLGGTYTTGIMILADQYPQHRRGMAIGFFIASASLGYGLSLIISGFAIPVGGFKLSFLLTCIGPLLGCVLAWITVWGTRIHLVKRQRKEKYFRDLLTNRPAMLYIGGYAFHCWELLGMWAWTPAFMTSYLMLSGVYGERATGIGSYITASFHGIGLLASFTMGTLSDRIGRARVILALSSISVLCSFLFGWTIQWPLTAAIGVGLLYAFSSLGDSPVLSAGLTESAESRYMGSAFGLRSLLGYGAGAVSPIAFGAILDWSNSAAYGYTTWGWAFSVFGMGGMGTIWVAHLLRKQSAGCS